MGGTMPRVPMGRPRRELPFPYRVVVEWSADDAAFVARVPALPGCAAHGSTPERAVREARRAAEGMLAVLREDRSKRRAAYCRGERTETGACGDARR